MTIGLAEFVTLEFFCGCPALFRRRELFLRVGADHRKFYVDDSGHETTALGAFELEP